MSKPVTIPNAFAAQAGPIPLSQLDADFAAAANAINDLATYSNYFADSSGAPNQLTVTVGAPLTFAYVTGIALQVKLANTTTATAVNINVNALGNKAVILNDGALPPVGSLTANSILDLMYDGASFRVLSMRASTTISTGLFGDGTAGAPSISFASDPDTGMFHVGANILGFAAGGVRPLAISSAQALIVDGTAGAPAYSFDNNGNLGLYRFAANSLGMSSNGAFVAGISPGQFVVVDGTAGAPSISFGSDPDTGMFHVVANVIGFACNGARTLTIGSLGALGALDGSAAAPTYTWDNDSDTGFYRDTGNQIAIGLGGVTAGQIAQGSYTLTASSGLTTTPAVTVQWQRIGNLMILHIPGITGTSNSNTLILSGTPAAIRPSVNQDCPIGTLSNNTVTEGGGALQVQSGGNIIGLRNGGIGNFTAAGTKGFLDDVVITYLLV